MILTREDGDVRLKYKVVSRATYREIVDGAQVVASNDETGTCTLLVPSIDSNGYVEKNDDGTTKTIEANYDLSGCGIATIRR